MPPLEIRVALSWENLRDSVRYAPRLEREDQDLVSKLKEYQAPLISSLLDDQTLFNLGLSFLDPTSKFSCFTNFTLYSYDLNFYHYRNNFRRAEPLNPRDQDPQ